MAAINKFYVYKLKNTTNTNNYLDDYVRPPMAIPVRLGLGLGL